MDRGVEMRRKQNTETICYYTVNNGCICVHILKTRVKWLAFCQPQSRILGQQWVLKSVNLVLSPAKQSEVR